MTRAQAKRLEGLINALCEAEREYVRAKLKFSSFARRDAKRRAVSVARDAVRRAIDSLATSA